MANKVSYDKALRDKAKAEKKKLITIDYDGRAVKKGRFTLQMIETPGVVKAVERAIAEMLKAWQREQRP